MATTKTIPDVPMWFKANFKGRCAVCLMSFEADEPIRRDPNDGRRYIAQTCCGDLAIDHTDDGPDMVVAAPRLVDVMPRGRKASDMCSRCFIVPSSNGVCGCE